MIQNLHYCCYSQIKCIKILIKQIEKNFDSNPENSLEFERNPPILDTGPKKNFQALNQDEKKLSKYEFSKKSNVYDSEDLKSEFELDLIIKSITAKTFKKQFNKLIMVEQKSWFLANINLYIQLSFNSNKLYTKANLEDKLILDQGLWLLFAA